MLLITQTGSQYIAMEKSCVPVILGTSFCFYSFSLDGNAQRLENASSMEVSPVEFHRQFRFLIGTRRAEGGSYAIRLHRCGLPSSGLVVPHLRCGEVSSGGTTDAIKGKAPPLMVRQHPGG